MYRSIANLNMKTFFFKTNNQRSVMESETISKNEASPKSHTIRKNPVIILFATAFVLLAIFTIATCSSSPSSTTQSVTVNKNLIGVWEVERNSQKASYVFFDNGTLCEKPQGYSSWYPRKYSTYENILMSTSVGRDGEDCRLYTFNISGNTLTLSAYGDTSDQSKITLKKVK